MSLKNYSREEIVKVLEKLEKEYPAVYRNFILSELEENHDDPLCPASQKSQCYAIG